MGFRITAVWTQKKRSRGRGRWEEKSGRREGEEKTSLPDFSRILEFFIFKGIAVKEWGRGAEWGRALIERGTKNMERKRNEGFRSLCNGFV